MPKALRRDQEIPELRDENHEPFERRAVRTFVDALSALETIVLGPVRAPSAVPRRILVPKVQAELVKVTGDLLRSSPIDQGRILSGPVIGLERRDESGPGEVKILAMYNSRERDVIVNLPPALYQQAVDCHRDNHTVIVEGDVEQRPPGRFRIADPRRFEPLDEGIASP